MTREPDAYSAQATATETETATVPAQSSRVSTLWRRFGPVGTELALVVAFYALYSIMRSASPDRYALAMGHADDIERTERALGLDIESGLNALFVRHQWLADFASYWYQTTHMAVTAGVLIWVWRRHRHRYATMRTALAMVMLGGLATYWLYPLAPPRFALAGAVDTMSAHPVLFWGDSVTGLANLYAAMPSLHVAWAFWCALTVVLLSKSHWKHIAWLYPLTMTFVVMGTANHYVLDAVAGVVYATVAVVACRALYARSSGAALARTPLVTPERAGLGA